MDNFDQFLPALPLADWVEAFVKFLTDYFSVIFKIISIGIESITEGLTFVLSIGPPFLLIIVISLIAWWVAQWKLGLFSLIGLGLINNLGYWSETVDTLSLIIVSRSEEHTSELQSRGHLVCRLLL